jgi:hypothetical protein
VAGFAMETQARAAVPQIRLGVPSWPVCGRAIRRFDVVAPFGIMMSLRCTSLVWTESSLSHQLAASRITSGGTVHSDCPKLNHGTSQHTSLLNPGTPPTLSRLSTT